MCERVGPSRRRPARTTLQFMLNLMRLLCCGVGVRGTSQAAISPEQTLILCCVEWIIFVFTANSLYFMCYRKISIQTTYAMNGKWFSVSCDDIVKYVCV